MRAKALMAVAFTAGAAAVVGCHHDKYKLANPAVEEYKLPPDEPRFNNPPTEQYKPPPVKKDDPSLLGGKNKMMGPGGPNGL
jgi:hypothetical protein